MENYSFLRRLYYLKIFNSYGGLSTYQKGLNVELFDAANKNDDYSVVQTLFDRFDGDAFFIFALLLLYEEYEKTGTIVITKNLGLLTATEGAIRFRHGGCYALTVLCFWSSYEGCDFNEEAAIDSLKQSKRNKFVVPETLIDFYNNIMSKVYREVQDGTFGYVA